MISRHVRKHTTKKHEIMVLKIHSTDALSGVVLLVKASNRASQSE